MAPLFLSFLDPPPLNNSNFRIHTLFRISPNQIDLSSFFSSFGNVFSVVMERAPCMDAKN